MPSSLASLALLGLLALSPLAAARPAPTSTQQARRSFQTPSLDLPPPQYLEDAAVRSAIANMAAAAQASAAVKARRSGLDNIIDVDIQKRGDKADGDTLLKRGACLDSTADDMLISSLFHYGGAGTVVELCPGATIKLTNPVYFSAAEQVLTTQGASRSPGSSRLRDMTWAALTLSPFLSRAGNPTDGSRATLVVTGQDQACAIFGACQGCDNVVVESVQVAGQRDVLGFNNGPALLELGGDNVGQTVKNCKLWEPRGWSALHGIGERTFPLLLFPLLLPSCSFLERARPCLLEPTLMLVLSLSQRATATRATTCSSRATPSGPVETLPPMASSSSAATTRSTSLSSGPTASRSPARARPSRATRSSTRPTAASSFSARPGPS